MSRYYSYLLLLFLLIVNSCSPSRTSGSLEDLKKYSAEAKVVYKTSFTVTVKEKPEIIDWKKTLEIETHRLAETDHKELEDIIKIVSENTQDLEQAALNASIDQCIERSKFSNELAIDATKEIADPEIKALIQSFDNLSEQLNEKMEAHCRKDTAKGFSKRRNRLIEKYYKNTKEPKTNDI